MASGDRQDADKQGVIARFKTNSAAAMAKLPTLIAGHGA